MLVYQQLKEPLWRSYTKVNLVWIHNLLQRYPQALTLAVEAKAELATLNAPDLSTLESYKGLLAMYHGETLNALSRSREALQSFDEAQQFLSKENNPRYQLMLYAARAPAEAAAEAPAPTTKKQKQPLNGVNTPALLATIGVVADQPEAKPLGPVKGDIRYEQYGWGAKAFEWGIFTHQGTQYGQINRIVMLAGCIIGAGESQRGG